MEQISNDRQRIISLEDSREALLMQAKLRPEIMSEIITLCGGSAGVLQAVVEIVAEEISFTPMEKTTPGRLRTIVGAPENNSELENWREGFWDKFKAENIVQ